MSIGALPNPSYAQRDGTNDILRNFMFLLTLRVIILAVWNQRSGKNNLWDKQERNNVERRLRGQVEA